MALIDKLYAIGDAIRSKTGGTELLPLDDMPGEIRGISTGIDTSDATAEAGDILAGETAYVDGIKITGNIQTQEAKTVTPSASEQTAIAAGVYAKGAVTVAGDSNLTAENIAEGVSIFGVTGTLAAGGGGGGFPNGTEWMMSNVTDKTMFCVHNANGLWVIGSSSGLYYSEDGKEWTQSNITSKRFHYLHYGNGLWVAGSQEMVSALYYSTDGKTWAQSNWNGPIRGVCYADGLWVVIGTYGSLSSTDGMSWVNNSLPSANNGSIFWADGLWVAALYGGGLYYSTDGTSWTQSNVTDTCWNARKANGVWVAASDANGLYYSTDGMTWTQSNITSGSFMSLCNGNGLWVAGNRGNGNATSGLYYSTDGMTWTASNTAYYNTINAIHYANGVWVAGDYSKGFYSTDGKIWNALTGTNIYSVYSADGIWVGGYSGFKYSVTWEPSN